MVPRKHLNDIIDARLNYFFVIDDKSVYKSYAVASFTSLINKKKKLNFKIASSSKP